MAERGRRSTVESHTEYARARSRCHRCGARVRTDRTPGAPTACATRRSVVG